MIIARLLTPADIGVFSVAMVLLSFVATIRDMGAGNYLLQEKEITVDRIRAVWALQLGIGLFLALVVLAISIPVAAFYNEPRMRDIMFVVALNYAINPFGSLTYAWQMREMRFDTLALVRFCSTLMGAVVSVYLAWSGMGAISLAYGSLASIIVNAVMAVYFRPKWFPWMPGIKEIRRVLAFGSRTTGAGLLFNLGGNAPELLLGKLQGMNATGLFSRASGLIQMFDRLVLTGIAAVAVSWFATHSRENGNIIQPFLKATSYVCAIGTAFSMSIIFLAYPSITLLYGSQWESAVILTQLLAVAAIFSLPAQMTNAAFMATGEASRVLRGTAITTGFTVIFLAVGAYLGLVEMGISMILASACRSVYWLVQAHQIVGFAWKAMRKIILQSLVVGIGAAIGPILAYGFFGPTPSNVWLPIILSVPLSLIGFLSAITATKHPLLAEITKIITRIKGQYV